MSPMQVVEVVAHEVALGLRPLRVELAQAVLVPVAAVAAEVATSNLIRI